jgi:NAD(P)-dependent dehydrogenase (short-subunit alcohol dehydrogenase family)
VRLAGKVILITGSTTGIGAAMARMFAREGARVALHGRDSARGAALAAELGHERAVFLQGDLADPAYPPSLVSAALGAFGRLDALVNNAALTTRAHLADTDAGFFDAIMAVNLRAPLLLIRAAVDALAQTRGAVLNIGSILAHCGQSNLLAYSVSKGGLMTLTRNLADTLAPRRVRVNQLNVGWTLTENEFAVKRSDGLPENWPDTLPASVVPSGRLLHPDDIARAAIYWVGDESRPITGTVADCEQYPVLGRIPNQEGDAKSAGKAGLRPQNESAAPAEVVR